MTAAYFIKLMEVLEHSARDAAQRAAELPAKIQVNANDMTAALAPVAVVQKDNRHVISAEFAENRNEAVILDFKPVTKATPMDIFTNVKKKIFALAPQSSFASSANDVSEKPALITLTDEAIRRAVPDNKGKVIQLSEYRNVA